MSDVSTAKQHLLAEIQDDEYVTGVGIGRYYGEESLTVYVEDQNCPVAERLSGTTYEGFPVVIRETGTISAY